MGARRRGGSRLLDYGILQTVKLLQLLLPSIVLNNQCTVSA